MNSHLPQDQLFSIDVEAHLKKAASHTFGSPAHYPVELIRAALRRNAKQVDISINGNCIQVQDDGSGLNEKELRTLIDIMEPQCDEVTKEDAVESLQTREGLGLLAIFASHPHRVWIENVQSATGKTTTLQFRDKHLEITENMAISKGTKITIYSRHRNLEQEKRLIDIFCRTVPKSYRLRMNNITLGGSPLLSRQMAIIDVSSTSFTRGGQIGIPRTGSYCHIKLLEKGIPWHHLTLPPQKGFVFDTAIEFTQDSQEIPESLMVHLLTHAAELYRWLCHRYSTAASYHQERIEDLIFTHSRLTGDLTYMHNFSPFKIYDSPYSLNLEQLRELARNQIVYAIPRQKENLKHNTSGKNSGSVISLTREQTDLLVNFLQLPVTFLSPLKTTSYRWHWFKSRLKNISRRILLALLPKPKRRLEAGELNQSEVFFINHLNRHLSKHGEAFTWKQIHRPGHAVMVESSGPFPTVKIEPRGKSSYYAIRRKHPLVQSAIQAVHQAPENIEIFIPQLF